MVRVAMEEYFLLMIRILTGVQVVVVAPGGRLYSGVILR